MTLSPAQLSTLKAAILADQVLAAKPRNEDGYADISAAFNLASSPAVTVWRSSVQSDSIFNTIVWANLTPQQAIPTDTALNAAIWQSKALACQGKQFNVQTLLLGKATVTCGLANVRAAFQDALTQVPSKSDGTIQQAGWAAVQVAFQRTATRAEALYATGTTVLDLVFEGLITSTNVLDALNS